MPLIDFSKIAFKGTPSKVLGLTTPARGRKIDFNAIKGPVVVSPVVRPIHQNTVGTGVSTSTWQKVLNKPTTPTPTPPAVSRLTSGYNPQKYNPEVTPVAPLLQTEAVKRWSAEAALARKATPEIGQRLLDGMDSFTKIIQPNITPSDSGRNTVVDFAGSIASVAAGVYAVKSLLSALGAGVLYLKTPRSVVDRETTTLFPRFDDSFQAQKYVLKLQQTDPAAAEKFKSDLVTLLAQTMAKDMPTTLSDESLQETASRMYDFLVSNGQAGSFATVGERFASATTAASNLGAAVGNPQMSLAVATQATSQLAKTGMLQLLPPLVVANRLGTIPMPAGLVHSTAPAIPMGDGTLPAPTPLQSPAPVVATAPVKPAKEPTAVLFNGKWYSEGKEITQAQANAPTVETITRDLDMARALGDKKSVARLTTELKNVVAKAFTPAPMATPAAVTRPVQAPSVKSYADLMAKEEAMGAGLNTTPAAVDKTIPAIDVKKANLVDVTAKVDLKSVQVKSPTATNVFVDTKRQTVLVTNGATPLEAIGIDKPQLKTWYGIEGAKLLGEATQSVPAFAGTPAPVVAQIAPTAPTLSKMETTATKQPWEMTKVEYDSQTLPNKVAFAIVKNGKVLLSGTDSKIGYLAGLAEEQKADLYVGDSAAISVDTQPRIMGFTFDEIKSAQQGGVLTGRPTSTMPKNAVQVPTYSQALKIAPVVSPDLSTTPQKGTATTILNQKTSISTSTPVSLQGEAKTGAGGAVPAVNGKKVAFKASNGSELTGDIISVPELYDFTIAAVKSDKGGWHAHELTSGYSLMTDSMGIVKTKKALGELIVRQLDKVKKYGESSPADALLRMVSPTKVVNPEFRRPTAVTPIAEQPKEITTGDVIKEMSLGGFELTMSKMAAAKAATTLTKKTAINGMMLTRKEYVEAQVRSGSTVGLKEGGRALVAPAGDQWMREKDIGSTAIDYALWLISEKQNPASVPTGPMTSTSAPAAAPAIGNAAPAHGLIDYSKIELNGTTSQTSPKVLASISNAGKGFDNYVQNTPGTTNTSLSPFAKFKAIRDGYIRFIANEYNWFFKSPLGGEWMTIAVAADDVMLEEYKKPFYITEAGEQVFVEGEFAPAILSRYLKASDVINKRYLQGPNGVDLVSPDGKKIKNPNYGKPDFGVFLQNLQRAGIPIEATKGLGADKTNLAQQHIAEAWMSLANFQKNMPELFKKYMAQAQEIGDANARLLPEFYKGIISPETYANDKANPHYYVSLSAGKTDIFDRSSVAPLERAHGLTNLDEVVPPLEGLMDVYVAAIRGQGINNAKWETVKSNKNSEVATSELSDSIVHLWKDGVDRAYEVHDKDAGASIRNLTRSKWEVPSLVKRIFTLPTTLMRLAATGVNIAFGAFNPVRDIIQAAGLVPFTPAGLVKGTVKAFKSPGLSQWSKDYRDPTRPTGAKATEVVKKIVEFLSIPSNVGESLSRDVIAESIGSRGGTYLDQFYGYHAGTGFFALHGTFFNDFISGLVPFTRATIAVVRAFYRNAFYGLPIGGKGGTFSGKQGAEKILGKNFLATIIFTLIEIAAIKAAGKEKEYKLLRDRASNFYLYQPSGNWVRLSVPILSAPIKAIVESLYGFESDPMDVAGQTLNVIPGLEAFMLPPALTTYLQYKFNINFFTGSPINTKYDTPAKNPLEAAIMKFGYTEEQADMALRSFFADIPSQVQYVFEMVTQGTSTQAFPLTKRFIVKDPTTSSNAAVDDFYALVDAVKASKNPALESLVNARANAVGDLLHNAKLYPENAKTYIAGATDFIIATFALIAENPSVYGIKKFGPFSWRPSGNYEELAP